MVDWSRFFTYLHGRLVPQRQHRLMWLETLVITLGAVALGYIFEPENPFQLGGQFPWIWLAPVLVALRYGVPPGIVSSLSLIAVWQLMDHLSEIHEPFPEQFFLGGLILTMVCGEFSAAWTARLRRAEEINQYLDERLSRITQRHLLLRLSHDRIEQEILTKPVSLRDALSGLRQLACQQNDMRMPAAVPLLQMLTQYCQLESAAFFIPQEQGGFLRLCGIGEAPDLLPDDPLLAYSLEHKALSHLMLEEANSSDSSPFLVVAPVYTSGGMLMGVLAIDRMPFLAVNQENLQMLSVMLGYYADCVDEAEGMRNFHARFPEVPADFAAEFARLARLQADFGVESYIIAVPFTDDEQGRQSVLNLSHVRRGLDISWTTQLGNRLWFVNLMPLANDHAVEGYLLRIEGLLREYLGHDDEWQLASTRISLSDVDPGATLQKLMTGNHHA